MENEFAEVADDPIHRKELLSVVQMLVAEVQKSITARIGDATAPLLARVAELESRPVVRYLGVWSASTEYQAGAMVTHAGSVWHCNGITRARPGDGAVWTLAVKRGADGK